MKYCLPAIIILFFTQSCNSKSTTSNDIVYVEDSTKFYQVNQFIKSQIDEVNKTPYFIYKITLDSKNNQDSSVLSVAEFNTLANQFLKTDISDPSLKKYYKENIFHDQTTKSITISYTTTNKSLEVQNIDVLLMEDGETLKRIFVRKFYDYNDSSAIEQLSWKPTESFQINRLVLLADNKETSSQTFVIWNEK